MTGDKTKAETKTEESTTEQAEDNLLDGGERVSKGNRRRDREKPDFEGQSAGHGDFDSGDGGGEYAKNFKEGGGEDEEDSDGALETTTRTDLRWEHLSTLVALPTALHFPALVFLDAVGTVTILGTTVLPTADLSSVPQSWFAFDLLGWLAALAYALGPEILKAAADVRGGGT